ncbi:MAG TPA: hypothetical protein VIX90_18420 [Edaphobacter sp.]
MSTLDIAELCDMAANGLVSMLDPATQIFCHIYRRTDGEMTRQGLSRRYTMMTLLGLHRYEISGRSSPVAISSVLEALLEDIRWISGVGDLGLLLWTCAELVPDQVPKVYQQVKASTALSRFSDGRQGHTMEVAWYLTGLMSCCRVGNSDLPGLLDQAMVARDTLKNNCGISGVYGHRRRSGMAGYVRRRIGSFADQVYPTIALAQMALTLNDDEARQMALYTARTMCQLQAPLGEWSWQYDAVSGRVVSRYPVYSVHQHAMAPMMLFAAGEAADWDFSSSVYKGLAWIGGNNELQRNFIEPALGLVWRCVYLQPVDSYADRGLRMLGMRDGTSSTSLKVNYECRPYELGWLLYAFAG